MDYGSIPAVLRKPYKPRAHDCIHINSNSLQKIDAFEKIFVMECIYIDGRTYHNADIQHNFGPHTRLIPKAN